MFKNSAQILFFLILASGTLITVSSNSWIGSWMGLEINLLAFIPLMNNTKNLMSTESSLKYFLTQALASAVLLVAIIIMMVSSTQHTLPQQTIHNLPHMIIFSSLLLKTGAAPFHFWFPAVMEGLTWMNSLILMTWQKIGPLMLLSYLSMNHLLIISTITSSIIGSLGGLNQTSLRKLMTYSSINHIGWMLAAMLSSEDLWLFYFLSYSFLSLNIIMMFYIFKLFHFNQMFNSFFSSKSLKFMMFINLLSLGGLPPFLGFLPKWLVIQHLTQNNQMMLMTVMTAFTLITLFFYLRMAFSAFMLNYYETSWFYSEQLNNTSMMLLTTTTAISLMGLVAVSMIFFIM